jgi:ketosteroid isomerase-like protein
MMPRILRCCTFVLAASLSVFAQTRDGRVAAANPAATRSEQEVLQALADLRLAILQQDEKALDRLIADSYLAVRVDGTFNDKAGLLKNNQSAAVKYDVYENQGGAKIRLHGDTAVVVSDVRTEGRNAKGAFKENRRVTSVWTKTDGCVAKMVLGARLRGVTSAPASIIQPAIRASH